MWGLLGRARPWDDMRHCPACALKDSPAENQKWPGAFSWDAAVGFQDTHPSLVVAGEPRVAAKGLCSLPSLSCPGPVPTAPPQNVQTEAVNSTTIRFLWSPPPQQFVNGINQGYKVGAWAGGRLAVSRSCSRQRGCPPLTPPRPRGVQLQSRLTLSRGRGGHRWSKA